MQYGPIYPTREAAERARNDAEFSTMLFHEIAPICPLFQGNSMVRPGGFIVRESEQQFLEFAS